jgi:phosphate transport system permease protein
MRQARFTKRDFIGIGGALLAAASVAGLLREVLAWRGLMSTGIWFYLTFLVVYYVVVRETSSEEGAVDRMITVVMWSIGALVVGALAWMIIWLFVKGAKLLSAAFFTQDLSKVGPLNSGGGAKAAIIGTIEQVGLATAFVVPVAVLTAIYLHEHRGRLARPVRFFVDALSGKPSVLAGLVIYAAWTIGHPERFSGVACSAALVILMLPTVTGTAEEVLRTIPDSLREASLALGSPQWRVVLRVVVPTALAGLMTAAILGVARAVGETAPALLTASYSTKTNVNPFHGPQADLPTFVYNLVLQPNKVQQARGYTGALVLVILVLILFTSARLISNAGRRKRGGI